jgi:Tol biopolymer transport system component
MQLLIVMIIVLLGGMLLLPSSITVNAATPTPSPTAPPYPVIVYSSNGQWSEMYTDQYGVYQLYLSTDRDMPLTDREGDYMQPAWSPDSERIAYAYNRMAIEVMNADGSDRQRLTEGHGEHSPAWSPDGSTIAYASSSDGAIYRMNPDGSEVSLLRDGLDVRSLTFSPDGTRLMLTSPHEGLDHLYVMDVDGQNMQPLLADSHSAWDGVWSPDGDTIAYATEDGIYLTDDEGKTSHKLEFTGYMTFALEDGYYYVGDLTWSPDGTQIAFVVSSRRLQLAVSTPVPLDRVGPQIAIVDVATGDLHLTTYGFFNANPDWQPVPQD